MAIFFGLSGTGKTTLSRRPGANPHRRRRARLERRRRLQLRGRLLRQDHPPVATSTSRTSTPRRAASGRSSRTWSSIPMTRELDLDSESSPRTRAAPSRCTSSRNSSDVGHRRPPVDDHLPDRRRVRRAAADLAADPRPGDVPLHQRLHGQAGRHRGRRQGANGHVLDLLRGAVHAAPPVASTRRCSASGMDRHDVPVWLVNTGWSGGPYGRRRADEHRPHAADGPRRAQRRCSTTCRRGPIRPSASRCRPPAPTCPTEVLWPRDTWADKDAYDRQARKLAGDVRRELQAVRGRRRRRSRRPARGRLVGVRETLGEFAEDQATDLRACIHLGCVANAPARGCPGRPQ